MIDINIRIETTDKDGSKSIFQSQATKEPVLCKDCAFEDKCKNYIAFEEQCAILSFEVWTEEKYLSFIKV